MSTALRTLVGVRAVAAHRALRRPATPAELAKRMISGYRVTPTIALISDAIADAVSNPDRRYIISTPPRTGKSVLTSGRDGVCAGEQPGRDDHPAVVLGLACRGALTSCASVDRGSRRRAWSCAVDG